MKYIYNSFIIKRNILWSVMNDVIVNEKNVIFSLGIYRNVETDGLTFNSLCIKTLFSLCTTRFSSDNSFDDLPPYVLTIFLCTKYFRFSTDNSGSLFLETRRGGVFLLLRTVVGFRGLLLPMTRPVSDCVFCWAGIMFFYWTGSWKMFFLGYKNSWFCS